MLVVVVLTVHYEFSIIIWEQIGLGAEIILREDSLHTTEILPHEVFAAHLETLREMVDFLIPSSVFQMLRFCLTCPHYIPFGAVRPYYPEPSILQ